MLTPDELATVRIALLFWSEEMTPHDSEIMQPYFDVPQAAPLSAEGVSRLRARFVPESVRYTLYSDVSERLTSFDVYSTHDEAVGHSEPEARVVTLLVRD